MANPALPLRYDEFGTSFGMARKGDRLALADDGALADDAADDSVPRSAKAGNLPDEGRDAPRRNMVLKETAIRSNLERFLRIVLVEDYK